MYIDFCDFYSEALKWILPYGANLLNAHALSIKVKSMEMDWSIYESVANCNGA